ncbi:L,D-transpeptidase [Propylenella binzhouense]|uniref:L,D-transpeptidase n=1 Tax=Propylenella binzhouense TaxID=2555902 RepID=A0A964T569_9HYPH|nr:L,D-transpeptidase [Propylenella binzhouense]MYZ48728.1 L,D-transpeptidase [Propylenella binzhouense]
MSRVGCSWRALVAAGFFRCARSATVLAVLLFLGCAASQPAGAADAVVARIDISEQLMSVTVDGRLAYLWRVSTGKKGYRTPVGRYRPFRLERKWYSRKYDGAMPNSVFFRGGYAVHGTTAIRSLGRPASHGCVRLHPDNARIFFNLVRKLGLKRSRIVIVP